MDAGKLNERLTLLQYSGGEWTDCGSLWGSAEQNDKRNLFSAVGIGARNVEFVIRRREITLHNAVLWRGQHCFLTGITDEGKGHLRITAAIITPESCKAYRSGISYNELRNPVKQTIKLFDFAACVTEKYMGYQQLTPQAQVSETLVLVTPKNVALKTGDLVDIGERGRYLITLPHTFDEFKNEYEAERTREGNEPCKV